jgi:hypothetical protein
MTRCLLATLLLALATNGSAQDPMAPVRRIATGSQLLSLPSTQMAAPGLWEVKFTHRFNQSLTDGNLGDQVHSLFGLDTNADVVFGLSRVVRPNLEVSLARSNVNDTIELASRYLLIQQSESGSPASVALRGGIDWRTERDQQDRSSLFVQAIASRQFGPRLEVFAMPTFATHAGRTIDGDESVALFEHAVNVPLAAIWTIGTSLAVVGELIPPNGDLPDAVASEPGWALGIKRSIGGHWFELLITNNQSTLVDQYVTSTYQGSGLDRGDIKLGFNIERRFGRRRP